MKYNQTTVADTPPTSSQRTHCAHGHDLINGNNVFIEQSGALTCRACRRLRVARSRRKKEEASIQPASPTVRQRDAEPFIDAHAGIEWALYLETAPKWMQVEARARREARDMRQRNVLRNGANPSAN